MRRAQVNLKALEHNFWRIKQIAPHSKIIAMVKTMLMGTELFPFH